MLDCLELQLRHEVLIHVQQYVLDHDDAQFDIGPHSIQYFQEIVVMGRNDLLSDWLKDLDRGSLHVIVEHIPVLVEYQTVRGAV